MVRLTKPLATAVLIVSLNTTTIFSVPAISFSDTTSHQQQSYSTEKHQQHCDEKDVLNKRLKISKQQDPIKALEALKERVEKSLKDGKISQEKADEITIKINTAIEELNKFNSLTLEEKKQQLISDFRAHIDEKVKEGKLTQDKADEIIEKHTKKVNNWDGNGYSRFVIKGLSGKWYDIQNKTTDR